MKRVLLLAFATGLLYLSTLAQAGTTATDTPVRKILAYGGALQKAFIKQVIALTGKSKPRICYLPTASGDNPYGVTSWYEFCHDLPVEPYVLGVWVNSSPGQQSFEDKIMSMDAIIVGGGNTLNMIAIWKAQGIDTVLRNAYNKGIVLAGGSAGSICWFLASYSDSRPKNLSIVNGLGFLPYSHCPHYHSEPGRKPLYTSALLDGRMTAGYACDDKAGILFLNEKYNKSVALDISNHTYFLSVKDGKIDEHMFDAEIIH